MSKGDSVSESIEINASVDDVYDAVADVSRMPNWSPELRGVRVPNSGPLTVGQTFAGINKKGLQVWQTSSRVVVADPPNEFAIKVTGAGLPVAHWSYIVEATSTGSRLTINWIDDRGGLWGATARVAGLVASGVWNRDKHNANGMRVTLQALKSDVEQSR